MPVAQLLSRALNGMEAGQVTVEVHLSGGLPGLTLVGLPETEVREARDRVRAALMTSGFEFPAKRITINLAPADLPKDSGRFDLPIALGILAASQQIRSDCLGEHEFAGELSLAGELRPVRGAIAMACAAAKAGRSLILPEASAREAALARLSPEPRAARSLLEVCAYLNREADLSVPTPPPPGGGVYPDLQDICGHVIPKRVLEIAASGGHSLLMVGAPGSGKSMLAQRLPSLLPSLLPDQALESAALLSVAGLFQGECFGLRPFRAPHHTASSAALVGGGSTPRPGEISLAHQGVLFLDELPEFDRGVLEALREPLETGVVHISRAARQASFPARFQLVAAMNPCPCGYWGASEGRCRCTPDQVQRYRSRLSGPLLDRIDLCIEVASLSPEELQTAPRGEASGAVAERVQRVRNVQHQRQGKGNAELSAPETDQYATPDEAGRLLLRQAGEKLHLSARSYHRILRVARTIADMEGAGVIGRAHLAEAIQHRRFDRLTHTS